MSSTSTVDPVAPARRSALIRCFTEHPDSVGESYLGHMRFALGFSGELFLAAAAALVHALFPSLCQTTASRAVKRMHAKLQTRH